MRLKRRQAPANLQVNCVLLYAWSNESAPLVPSTWLSVKLLSWKRIILFRNTCLISRRLSATVHLSNHRANLLMFKHFILCCSESQLCSLEIGCHQSEKSSQYWNAVVLINTSFILVKTGHPHKRTITSIMRNAHWVSDMIWWDALLCCIPACSAS